MTKSHATTTNKEMETRLTTLVQDEIHNLESKIESKIAPIHASVEKLLTHFKDKQSIEVSSEPHGEETSHSRKDHPSYGFFNSQQHTLGDTP